MKYEINCKSVSGFLNNNPNNIILEFEDQLLNYISRYPKEFSCVITDSATNALNICLYVNKLENKEFTYEIPNQTYISVYLTLLNNNCKTLISDIEWENYYRFGNIIDSAGYLPNKNLEEILNTDYLILSFGNAKPLPMNKGGAIIFRKDINKYNLLKRLIHDGRDSALPVEKDNILKIDNKPAGFKYNLVPQQVELGLKNLLSKNFNKVKYTFKKYPKITEL